MGLAVLACLQATEVLHSWPGGATESCGTSPRRLLGVEWESATRTWEHRFWVGRSFCPSSESVLSVGSSIPGPLALRLAAPLSFPRCAFCWAELGNVFTSLILFLPSLPSIPLCFFPFLNHYHNLGFQTSSIRQRQSPGDQITFMCGLNTAHKLLSGKENNNFALEHEDHILL